MNRNVLIGLLVVVLAGAGYYQFSYVPAQRAAEEAAAAAKAAEEAAAAAAAEAEAAAQKAAEEAAAAAAAAEAEAAAAAAELAAALDVANFDAARINTLIDGSELDMSTKNALKASVNAAATNPALVQGAVDQVRAALVK